MEPIVHRSSIITPQMLGLNRDINFYVGGGAGSAGVRRPRAYSATAVIANNWRGRASLCSAAEDHDGTPCQLKPRNQQNLARFLTAFANEASRKTTVYNWFAEYKHGRVNFSIDFSDGRPSTAVNNRNIDAVRRIVTDVVTENVTQRKEGGRLYKKKKFKVRHFMNALMVNNYPKKRPTPFGVVTGY
ncbi:hypothetical protein EVAR_52357_1 [Eumeta japonica]|uniref:Mos1 transposase HTH domain-containing protein n=1 Tax=Eumeta variegata TaxID=151549 RepID=A0A4C1YTK2_EUMVA|nr:hypothetical protein EVAR_52357_1 [Eumeta japonica]